MNEWMKNTFSSPKSLQKYALSTVLSQELKETHHETRIPERDVTSYLFTYLRLSIDIHWIGSGSAYIYGYA